MPVVQTQGFSVDIRQVVDISERFKRKWIMQPDSETSVKCSDAQTWKLAGLTSEIPTWNILSITRKLNVFRVARLPLNCKTTVIECFILFSPWCQCDLQLENIRFS